MTIFVTIKMMTNYFGMIFVAIILIISCILFKTSRTFRYYIKYLIFTLHIGTFTAFLIPIFIFRPRNVKNLRILAMVVAPITKIIGVNWELRGRNILEQDRTYIIVSNHQSLLDFLGMYQIWPIMNKCTAIAKREIFYLWPCGLAAWLGRLIFIDRMNSDSARIVLNNATDYIKKNNIKLWIYPEGTRRSTGMIHTFKKGAFHVAIRAQLPIVPVVFSSYYFLSKREKKFESGRVIIKALPEISTKGLTVDDVDSLLEKTRNIMINAFNEINREIQSSNNSSSS